MRRLGCRQGRGEILRFTQERPDERTTVYAAVLVLVACMALGIGRDVVAQEGTPAAGFPHHAGLVIRHGDGRVTYAYVAFPEEEISGIELLRRSGVEQVTIPFGGLGEGVCAIEGEGCPATECRRRLCQAPGADSPYWRSFGLDETGAWRPFVLGPSSTTVRDGDVQLWSWTPADPGLPAVTLGDVARLAGAAEGHEVREATVSVRTVYPEGYEPPDDEEADPLLYAGAGAVLVAIAGGTLYALRRERLRTDRGEPDSWEAA